MTELAPLVEEWGARARQALRVGAARATDQVPAQGCPRVSCAGAVPEALEAVRRLIRTRLLSLSLNSPLVYI